MKPLEASNANKTQESSSKDDSGPKVADWRFGPAQIWYDMLDVPETGDGFNYGFKMKEKVIVIIWTSILMITLFVSLVRKITVLK